MDRQPTYNAMQRARKMVRDHRAASGGRALMNEGNVTIELACYRGKSMVNLEDNSGAISRQNETDALRSTAVGASHKEMLMTGNSVPRLDSSNQGEAPINSATNTETPHDYTMREAELCLSAVLAHLAKADIHIIKHTPSRHAPFYEVRHGLRNPRSWSTYDTLHEAYAHALIVAQVVAKSDTEAAARGAGGEG